MVFEWMKDERGKRWKVNEKDMREMENVGWEIVVMEGGE